MKFFTSYVSPNAREYVSKVLDSGVLSEGEWTRRFERAIENFLRFREGSVIATNSGTSALHLALKALGIGEGDEVIVPPNTFVATGLAVLYCGARVVFADILPDGNIDPDEVRKKITAATKAIIAVNWAGKDCEAGELQKIADLHGVKFIIDAAQSFGSLLEADAVCYSFQATKHVTCGDGGAVYFKDPEDCETARKLSWFGIDRQNDLPDILGERVYNLSEVGFKYHMNNVSAAIGLANIENAGMMINLRKVIALQYELLLTSVQPIHKDNSVFWAYPVRVNDARRFSAYCEGAGVPHSIIHRGIDHNAIFGGVDNSLVEQRLWEQTVVHIPVHRELSPDDIWWICEKVNEYVE